MSDLANRIKNKLKDDQAYHTFSVRISKKHFDLIQELERITGKKPSVLARACLEAAIDELYESEMYQGEY